MAGYLNFWAIPPHPLKKTLLCRCMWVSDKTGWVSDKNKENESFAYPIRGIDYDPEEKMLYIGDEMGVMRKLDVSPLLYKLDMIAEEQKGLSLSPDKASDPTFGLTATANKEPIKFSQDDVRVVAEWEAHKDAINWVTWVPALQVVASSGYDCQVMIFGADPADEE